MTDLRYHLPPSSGSITGGAIVPVIPPSGRVVKTAQADVDGPRLNLVEGRVASDPTRDKDAVLRYS